MAHHDALTGLPNRALFLDRMECSLARARRERRGGALLCIDLDRFKPVNDTWGHLAGAGEIKVGASIGVAYFCGMNITAQALLELADINMYRMKRTGGSACRVFRVEPKRTPIAK